MSQKAAVLGSITGIPCLVTASSLAAAKTVIKARSLHPSCSRT
jgi:hypothetical protein